MFLVSFVVKFLNSEFSKNSKNTKFTEYLLKKVAENPAWIKQWY